MSVKLYHRDFGMKGKPHCLIAHGLLGSSRNWMTAGKALSERFDCSAIDLRNHGHSPHTQSMTYREMARDMITWLDEHDIEKTLLIGHSLGGKVCMETAVNYPDRVEGLVVLDISNKAYSPRWEKEFKAMQALPLDEFKNRGDAEKALEPVVSDWAFRKFICSNLERSKTGDGFEWGINLEVIFNSLPDLFRAIPQNGKGFDGSALFIRGEYSKFLVSEDMENIKKHFPRAELKTVERAGHNVHFDNLKGFIETLKGFPK